MTKILSIMLQYYSRISGFCFMILFAVNIFIFPSCKKYDNNVQIRQIDTLINWNNNAKNMLIIDAQSIEKRCDSMRIKISVFDSNSIKSSGDQLKSDLVLYNGLLNKYKTFVDNYADIEFENSVNSRLLDDLKKKIVDHKIPNKTLDTLIKSQEKIIHSHLLQTQEIVQTIFSIEEMYHRLNNRINPFYENNIYRRNLN